MPPLFALAIYACATSLLMSVESVHAQGSPILTRGPYVQRTTTNSILIAWHTDVPTTSRVEYGFTSTLGLRAEVSTVTTKHTLTLMNLVSGTQYFYRGGDVDQLLSPVENFRTNPLDDSAFRFAVFGDSGAGTEMQLAVATQLQAVQPDFCLHTGDVIYPDGRADFFDARFFQPYRETVKSAVIYTSLGNHDVLTDNGTPYLDAFFLPQNNPQQTERYYSFNYGNAHFVALDTNQSLAAESPQMVWLRDDLANNQSVWTLVFFHHSPYSSSLHANNTNVLDVRLLLAPVMDEFKVDIVFGGHDHDYERSFPLQSDLVVDSAQEPDYNDPRGTIYVVTGGGGQTLYPAGTSFFTAFSQSVGHVTVVDINRTQLVLQAVTSNGEIIDRMTLTKAVENQVSTLSALTPTSATAGALGFTLIVTGSGFLVDSVLRWNGEVRPTTFVSTSELQSAIPASDLISGGNIEVTVFNASPSEGISNKLAFSIADFAIASSPTSATVSRGLSATYTVTLSPQFGSFDSSISLACSSLPSLSSCLFSAASVTLGSSDATSILTISTAAASASLWPPFDNYPPAPIHALWIVLTGLSAAGLALAKITHWKHLRFCMLVGLLVLLVLVQAACAGKSEAPPISNLGSPTGNFTITINASTSSLQRTTTVALIVQ